MNRSPSRMIAYMAWIIASVFYAYQYVLRVMPNIILNDLMQQFQINAADFGQFSGIYYIGYSLIHLPIGLMLDRYGPRKIMTGCILLTVIGLSPLVLAHHWIFPVLGRLLIGLGSSAAILGIFKMIRILFKEGQFPRMLSFSVTIGLMGAIYGGGPVHYMCNAFGYQLVIYLFGAIGVLLAIATYWIVPEIKDTSQGSVFSNLKEVLTNRKVIGACFFAGLMVGPLEGFADVWGTAFLKQTCGLDGVLAASLPSLIFIGMCFGSPLLSFIAEKAGSYLLTIIGAGIVMAISFVLLLTFAWTPTLLSLYFILIGICSAYQILAIYRASTYVREHVAGLTTAMANMIIMVFGYAFHTVIGAVIHAMGGPSIPQALLYGIGAIPIGLCLGSCGFLLLWIQEKKAPAQIKI